MNKPPHTIYLQWGTPEFDGEREGVTWCVDKINDTDIEYERSTTITLLKNSLAAQKRRHALQRKTINKLRTQSEDLKTMVSLLHSYILDNDPAPQIPYCQGCNGNGTRPDGTNEGKQCPQCYGTGISND